jgi:hypothetical protein
MLVVMRARTAALAAALAIVVLGFLVEAAMADHHLVKIREVFPGSTATDPGSEFVELQMYSSDQDNLAPASSLEFFNAAGASVGTQSVADVVGGQTQRTALIASDEAETDFGVTADTELQTVGGLMNPAGGAVCFKSTSFGTIDCVAWGAITGAPASAGTPAGAITDGSSLERSIAPGCPTLLESGDDTNSSVADFSLATPTPRPNASAPTETACTVPSFAISGPSRTADRTPRFRFEPSEPVTDVECKLDSAGYAPCSSPFTTKRLKPGRHTIRVRGTSTDDATTGTSSKAFTVKRRRR